MINVSELITDPDFCQPFTIIRTEGTWQNGLFVKQETQINVIGVAEPVTGKDLDIQIESDRANNVMTFYTLVELKVSPDGSISDFILFNGKRYKLFQVSNYSDFGYYSGMGKEI